MEQLNLTANGKSQERILAYLKENASEILADKINNGVKVIKDGKELVNKKTLDGFMKYASDEARKFAEKSFNAACIDDPVVFGWAIHYFEEDSIEEKLFNPNGTEFKPVVKTQNTQKPIYTATSKPKPKENTLFDLLYENEDTSNKEEVKEPTREIIEIKEKPKQEPERKPHTFYQEYIDIQNKYPSHVVCYRLGDFYEIFGKKAIQVSDKLDLTLTGRDCGLEKRIEMVGFPYHASDMYFKKILALSPIVIYENGEIKILTKQEESIVDIETGEILGNDLDSELEQEKQLKAAFDKDVLYKIIDLIGDILIIE